jgi:hypothetical protein
VPATRLYLNITVGADVPLLQQPDGWQVSFALHGTADLAEVSTAGAALYALGDGPNLSGGFDATEIVDPAKNLGQKGFVSGVVLGLKKATRLDEVALAAPTPGGPPGTVSILRIDLSGVRAQTAATTTAELIHDDGLVGSGERIDNKLSVEGRSVIPCNVAPLATADVDIEFVAGPREQWFLRGDPNDDGQCDIDDAIWILNENFRNGPVAPCEDSSDANKDGVIDPIVDAAYILAYQFSAGPIIPEPFGRGGAAAQISGRPTP